MLYCSATFTHNYLVMVADDYFYNYVGKLINISISDLREKRILYINFLSNIPQLKLHLFLLALHFFQGILTEYQRNQLRFYLCMAIH